ncbi:albusnodin/ikarugamycin family macrolactam cyclase [Actinospica durhamensis]|uniref:Albusnodin/ikarugamycin family macrolactam cyclase n=1 Tax=Actinospica durhamensis TaxID=1508375 RepID=A0A941EKQ5_9ACTN|nr:albusnodin/ikarugamycin family macrolactam cyclase [Actinospica durhamensis]MBR7832956.1 albusnodin/ikarugamycin family macrolactam cyclase [Actinospica durhamensis]
MAPGFLAAPLGEPGPLPGLEAAGLPWLRLTGDRLWPAAQVRILRTAGTVCVVFGHCLAEPSLMEAQYRACVDGDVDGVMRWPGAYAALVMCPRGFLRAYTDVTGQFPVYLSHGRGGVLVASDPRLLASLHRRAPDPVTAAARIACPDALPLWTDRSFFTDVSRLPGGTVCTTDGRTSQVRSYARLRPETSADFAECAEQVGAALIEAVRLRSGVRALTSDLSGGYDSTSLALLAAARHDGDALPAVVYRQPLAPTVDADQAWRCAAAADGRIRLTELAGSEATLPYGAPPWFAGSEPWPSMVSWRRMAVRLEFAVARRARVHLTGEGGDALLVPPPAHVSDLWRTRDISGLRRQCTAMARSRDVSAWAAAKAAVRLSHSNVRRALSRLAADFADDAAGAGEGAGRSPGFRARPSDIVDAISRWPTSPEARRWLTPDMSRALADLAGDPGTAARVAADTTAAESAVDTALRNSAETQRYYRELGHALGIAVHAPFLDSAVVAAALRLPPHRLAPVGDYKPLLRLALAGAVAPEVFERTDKGDYTAEDYRGARRAGPVLSELLEDSRLAQLGVIEPGRVSESLARMQAGVAVPMGSLNHLLSIEAWLRAQEHEEGKAPIG